MDSIYKRVPNELFASQKKSVQDFSEQRETATKLVECFGRLNIRARLVAVNFGYSVSAYIFEALNNSAFKRIKDSLEVVEYELATHSIRVYEGFRTYKRSIATSEESFFGESEQKDYFMQLNESGSFITVEIPLAKNRLLLYGDVVGEETFDSPQTPPLTFPVGMGVDNKLVLCDIAAMPHLMIAGRTGSGKSACINTIIASLIKNNSPQCVNLLLIDPKQVEFSPYIGLPHSLTQYPIYDVKQAISSLNYAVEQISKRQELLAAAKTNNIKAYNEKSEIKLPYLVIIIDELAELMMWRKKDVERIVGIICQRGRAMGVHLIFATQRPSIDVLSGVIRAHMSASMVFSTSTSFDSRVVCGQSGAEKLLGRGDMLFMSPYYTEPKRIQGCYISMDEVDRLAQFIRQNTKFTFDEQLQKQILGENAS